MKRVEDLIEELQKLPPEAEVFLGSGNVPECRYHAEGYVTIERAS